MGAYESNQGSAEFFWVDAVLGHKSSPELYRQLIERIKALCSPIDPIPTNQSPRLAVLPEVKAVVFDVYGTLITSEVGDIGLTASRQHEQAFADALKECGIMPLCDGIGAEVARYGRLNRLQRESLIAEGIDYPEMDVLQLWADLISELKNENKIGPTDGPPELFMRLAIEYEFRLNNSAPMPYLEETLDALRFAGIPYGIVSNAQFYSPMMFEAFLGKSVEQLGFSPELISWSYQQRASKPSRLAFEPVLAGLKGIGLSPGEVLFVGNDMKKDVYGACGVGMKTALFAGDTRSLKLREEDPSVDGVVPDVVVTDLSQLKNVLGLTRL